MRCFKVQVKIDNIKLPWSELCQESFLELRGNKSRRICGEEDGLKQWTLKGSNMKIRLRYHPNEEHDEAELDNIMGDYTLKMKSLISKFFLPIL